MISALLLLALVGCASRDLRTATAAEAEGRLEDAAMVWVTRLESDMDDLQARHRLELVQKRAWDQEVERATAALAGPDPEAALAAWKEVAAFRDRLAGVEAVGTPHADEVRPNLAKAEEALALWHYDKGVAAAGQSHWDVAISEYEAARKVRPEFKDTTPRIAQALAAQGDLDRVAQRYADALAHYDAAYKLSGNDDAHAWATAIRAAWGRADLTAGRCRAAFDALTAVSADDPSVEYDLERARQCARLELVVPSAEDAANAGPVGISVGGQFSDRFTAELRAQGSAHVRLLDPVSPPPLTTGRRYTVRTRLTEEVVSAKDATEQRSGTGVTQVACDSLSSDAFVAGVGYVCDADVVVTWTENVRSQQARVAGTVRWFSQDGVEIAAKPFEGTETREVRWVTGYQVDGVDVKRAAAPAPGVVAIAGPVPPSVAPAGGADTPDAVLITNATAAAAKSAATTVLGAVDAVEVSPPPTRLDIKAPAPAPRAGPEPGHAEPM